MVGTTCALVMPCRATIRKNSVASNRGITTSRPPSRSVVWAKFDANMGDSSVVTSPRLSRVRP